MRQSIANNLGSGEPLIVRNATRHWEWYPLVKPLLDRIVAAAALVVLLPVLVAIASAIAIDSPGNPIFIQRRLGLNGREFRMFKFRTMTVNADDRLHRAAYQRFATSGSLQIAGLHTFKIVNDPRVTRVGRFLRATSVDELPQLVNILLGSMSLVGPRPPIPWETQAYSPAHWRRLSVRPGLTGLWQATARSVSALEEMVALDLNYIDNLSLVCDVKILLWTVGAVLSRKGAG